MTDEKTHATQGTVQTHTQTHSGACTLSAGPGLPGEAQRGTPERDSSAPLAAWPRGRGTASLCLGVFIREDNQ